LRASFWTKRRSDRLARSVKHFLDVLDELSRLNIEYVSFRENIDTAGPLGRAIVVIIGAVAELERNLIIERVRAGMRRARLEGQHIGRNPLVLDDLAIQRDRGQGQSIRQIAKGHRVSTATIQRVLRKHPVDRTDPDVSKGVGYGTAFQANH
jgi:DNA invertase Pin-like site-specific DNA recombinase